MIKNSGQEKWSFRIVYVYSSCTYCISTMEKDPTAALLERYLHELQFPSKNPAAQILVCPVGLIGAGKTTVMKPLSEKLSLVRISTDRVRILLREASLDEALVEKEGFILLKNLLKDGYSVGIDADCSAHKMQLEKVAKEMNVAIIWIHINPPRGFILEKLSNLEALSHDHPKVFANSTDAVEAFHNHIPVREQNFATTHFPFVYEFDTSKKEELPRQIEEAATIIQNLTQ